LIVPQEDWLNELPMIDADPSYSLDRGKSKKPSQRLEQMEK
jgi:hypothetical protein